MTLKNTGNIIPEGVEAEVLKYLTFEDLNHQDVFKGNLMIPEKSIYQYMGETDFDEPIRFIFRNFDNAGVDDGVRLENIKALMKNKNFVHDLEKSNAIMKLVYSYPCHADFMFLNSNDGLAEVEFLDWLETQRDCPEKDFLLACGNDLNALLSRGCQIFDGSTSTYPYHDMLPTALADTFQQLIKRGDQHAADVFDLLMSNEIISDWFSLDVWSFDLSITGQSKVFFKDSFFGHWREHPDYLIDVFVENDRVDILNECLKELQGQTLYEFYDRTVSRVLRHFKEDPGGAFKMAKDLITENLQIVKNSTPIEVWDDDCYETKELRVVLLTTIVSYGEKYQLASLLEFMFAEYQKAGIVIRKDEALGLAARLRNHEYDQFFLDNLHD